MWQEQWKFNRYQNIFNMIRFEGNFLRWVFLSSVNFSMMRLEINDVKQRKEKNALKKFPNIIGKWSSKFSTVNIINEYRLLACYHRSYFNTQQNYLFILLKRFLSYRLFIFFPWTMQERRKEKVFDCAIKKQNREWIICDYIFPMIFQTFISASLETNTNKNVFHRFPNKI